MIQYDSEISARDYLLTAAEGPNFVYIDLHMGGSDDGPFGDDNYSGVEHLDLRIPEDASANEIGLPIEVLSKLGIPSDGKLLKLSFEDRDERFNPHEGSRTWANMLILPTPRDPKGPFTISVYQDFTHVGWLTGPDAEPLAVHLVQNFDFGCAIIPSDSIEESDSGEFFFSYFLKEEMPVEICRLPNRIRSAERVAPSKLEWAYEPEVIDLPRNVSWDGKGLVSATLENDKFANFQGELDLVYVDHPYEEIILMADIWEPESKDVFVYVSDEFVGRIIDPEEAAKFHEELGGYEPKLGRANGGYFYRAPGEPDGFDFDADVRSIIRIDWDLVEFTK
jgi:hypothetical protein